MPRLLMSNMSNGNKLKYYYAKLDKEYTSLKSDRVLCGTTDCHICCCKDCAKNNGYFNISIPDRSYEQKEKEMRSQINILKKKYKFSDDLGFFRIGVGCRLPITERSMTCVSYFCYDMYEKTRPSTIPRIVALCHTIQRIKKKIGIIY